MSSLHVLYHVIVPLSFNLLMTCVYKMLTLAKFWWNFAV